MLPYAVGTPAVSTPDRLTTHAGLGYPSAYSITVGDEIRSANIACVKTV